MNKVRNLAMAVGALALLASACGQGNGGIGGNGGGDGIDHPTGSDDIVLRLELVGGFVPIDYTLRAVPRVSLYGDGRLIVEGPVIEIYPGPALPNLQVTRLSEEAVAAILEAARGAGLMDGDATYDYPCVADAGTTRFTVVADGRTNVVSAYALGLEAGDCPDVDAEPRAALAEFQAKLGDLPGWLPEGSIGREETYVPTEMRVYVQPYRGEPELPQSPIEWPLEPGLDTFGEPVEVLPDARCGVVSEEDLSDLLAAATEANQLTPWTTGAESFALAFRPLLPDEHDC